MLSRFCFVWLHDIFKRMVAIALIKMEVQINNSVVEI